MNLKLINEQLTNIRYDLRDIKQNTTEKEIEIKEDVQHSIIWGIVVIVVAWLITWTVRTFN